MDSQNSGRLKHLTSTTALLTGWNFASRPTSVSGTRCTGFVSIKPERFADSSSRFFQGQRHIGSNVGTSLFAAAASTPENVSEHSPTTASAEDFAERSKDVFCRTKLLAAFETSMTITIVTSTFVIVTEDFVSLGSLFETLAGVFITRVAVGMKFNRELTIRFGDIAIRRVAGDSKHFVVVAFRHLSFHR